MSDYYYTNIDGEVTHVYPLEDCIKAIQRRNKDNEKRIACLEDENKKLKEGVYKDEKMSEMKQQLEAMREDYLRDFPIYKEEQEKIEQWKKRHNEEEHKYSSKNEGCAGGGYKYVFVPTSIGVSGRIVCHCGAEFEFQKIE